MKMAMLSIPDLLNQIVPSRPQERSTFSTMALKAKIPPASGSPWAFALCCGSTRVRNMWSWTGSGFCWFSEYIYIYIYIYILYIYIYIYVYIYIYGWSIFFCSTQKMWLSYFGGYIWVKGALGLFLVLIHRHWWSRLLLLLRVPFEMNHLNAYSTQICLYYIKCFLSPQSLIVISPFSP